MLRRWLGRREAPVDDGRRGRPDVPRVGDLSADEVESLVRKRRARRRLKALAAAGLAVAAGLFLSCAGRQPVPEAGPRDTGPADAGTRDAGSPDAGSPDSGAMDAEPRDAVVDVGQHRDGMPVPDNLLE